MNALARLRGWAIVRWFLGKPRPVLTHSLNEVFDLLSTAKDLLMSLSPDMQRIADASQKQTTEIQSLKILISGLAGQIRANAADEAAMKGIADQLEGNEHDLASMVLENTPAADPAPTAPTDPAATPAS